MAAAAGGALKCRLRLEAVWTSDGSADGNIDETFLAVRTMLDPFAESDCTELRAADRTRIQLVYIPAVRDPAAQVSQFLRGRLWKAINWSTAVRNTITSTGEKVNAAFTEEKGVSAVMAAVSARWKEVEMADTDTSATFRPIDIRFEQFIRKVEVSFKSDANTSELGLEDLSDGQRSLFHIALVAATLDIESTVGAGLEGFQAGAFVPPPLTVLALEEPENNLAPFFLSRVLSQLASITAGGRAQAVVSSHSPGILGRINPEDVRHFRLDRASRTSQVNSIVLPPDSEEAGKFVREAVRSYPELYFARAVVLGEGSSEEVVLPRIAEAQGLSLDPSFIAFVPLGGRHVNHLWRLLRSLRVPHATLLDLDYGRAGGGWGRVKNACTQLVENGVAPAEIFGKYLLPNGIEATLKQFDGGSLPGELSFWLGHLETFGVFFSMPLDLDMSMLKALPSEYLALPKGMKGPSPGGDPAAAVLGQDGDVTDYDKNDKPAWQERFLWYRYLFLGRGKPSTHLRVLSQLAPATLAKEAPEPISRLLAFVKQLVAVPQ